MIRFCQPTDPAQVRFWFELLGAINVGFAVCSPNGRVLAAIDIEDGRASARRSMQIKQAVLAACRVRYVRYAPEQTPSVPELQLLVPAAAAQWPSTMPAALPASALPLVPGQAAAAVMRSGARPAAFDAAAAVRQRAHPARWPDSGYLKDSTFGRDSVISGFSSSLPGALPERSGEVVESAPPLRH